MFITISKYPIKKLNAFKRLKKLSANNFILKYNFNASETILNNYLLKTEKRSLKNICLWLVNNVNFLQNTTGEVIAIFTLPEQNRLAELITYGNLEVTGSFILRDAIKERI